ncbi:MAG: hypothetical protein GXO47_05720 [Chlorobi bacterium]|nr:hypothetical protein [Chlorobiota bacterium]
MITHEFTDNIIHINFTGEVTFDQLKELSKNFSEQRIKGDTLLLLYDLRNAKLNFTVKDYKNISDMAQESTKGYKMVKAAFVVSSPKLTAMLSIFAQLTWSRHTQRKVFSTTSAALAWLRLFNKHLSKF